MLLLLKLGFCFQHSTFYQSNHTILARSDQFNTTTTLVNGIILLNNGFHHCFSYMMVYSLNSCISSRRHDGKNVRDARTTSSFLRCFMRQKRLAHNFACVYHTNESTAKHQRECNSYRIRIITSSQVPFRTNDMGHEKI